jgi:hypothetical protein
MSRCTRPTRRIATLVTTALVTSALLAVPLLGAPPAMGGEGDLVDPAREAANYAKTGERAPDYLTPTAVADQVTQGAESFADGVVEQASDPGRLFLTDLCWSTSLACGGDTRLHHWEERGDCVVEPIQFVARNGSTMAGHVWATKAGPA